MIERRKSPRNEAQLNFYRLNAKPRWFDTIPQAPVASLATVRPGRGSQARKRFDTLARV